MNFKQLLAQAYCVKRNSKKQLDGDLIEDMDKIIVKEIKKLRRFYYNNCEGIIKNKKIGRFILIDDLLRKDDD